MERPESEGIDPEEVLKALDDADDKDKELLKPEDGTKQRVSPARETAQRAEEKSNVALDVAWKLAERDVKKTCPDLDADDIVLLKAAASSDPIGFVEKAERLQARYAAAKTPKESEKTDVQKTKEKLAAEIFDGGSSGGDPNAVKVTPKTAEQKLEDAVKSGDSKGIVANLSKHIEEKKLFQGGVTIRSGD